jgi:hypothetical protein
MIRPGVKITEVPTSELRRIVLATERAVGPKAAGVQAMRRELERREHIEPLKMSRSISATEGGEDAG